MSRWIVLSDQTAALPADGLVDRGVFVLDVEQLPDQGAVLLDYQADVGWPRTLSVYCHPDAGLMILQRQGAAMIRHALPGPLPRGPGAARLTFGFDAPARIWTMQYEVMAGGVPLRASGTNPLPLRRDDLAAIGVGHNTNRHRVVSWFGVTVGMAPPAQCPWIGPNTPIDTPLGVIAAGQLRSGDLVMTDDGPQPLHAVTRHTLPCRGPFAPVLLRAPFFGNSRDLLVSADQLVAISGPEVEYLFAEDEVLLPAAALIDHHRALPDLRRPEVTGVALRLGRPALLNAHGCTLLMGSDRLLPLPCRVLEPYEILPLIALLAPQARQSAARR